MSLPASRALLRRFRCAARLRDLARRRSRARAGSRRCARPAGGCGATRARRAAQRHRLADSSAPRASSVCSAMPRCCTCGSANTWSIVLIGPHGTPASFSSSTQSRACRAAQVRLELGVQRVAVLRARRRGGVVAGASASSGAPIASQKRSQISWPEAAMLMWPSRGREHAGRDARSGGRCRPAWAPRRSSASAPPGSRA